MIALRIFIVVIISCLIYEGASFEVVFNNSHAKKVLRETDGIVQSEKHPCASRRLSGSDVVDLTKQQRLGRQWPIYLNPQDRIIFYRFRKVGSTSFVTFLEESGLCSRRDCVLFGQAMGCFFSSDSCACPKDSTFTPGYLGCNHDSAQVLVQAFEREKCLMSFNSAPAVPPRFFTIVLVRNPVERVLSEIFYTKTILPLWRFLYPRSVDEVANGDVEGVIRKKGPAFNRMTLQLAGAHFAKDVRSDDPQLKKYLKIALSLIEYADIVLVEEHLALGFKLFSEVFRRLPNPQRLSKGEFIRRAGKAERVSKHDPLREAASGNSTIIRMIEEVSWADVQLYKAAKRKFYRDYNQLRTLQL